MKLLSHAINFIFPATCKNCNRTVSANADTSYFCKDCWQGIEWFNCPCCPQCGLPYVSPQVDTGSKSNSRQSAVGHLCGNCREKPPPFDMAISAGRYAGALAEAIKLFKYKKKIQLGKRLTEQALKSSLVGNTLTSAQTVIIPVPLHVKRLREREFNQSAIIGSVIGKNFGIPIAATALVRHRNTKPQVELNGKERKENVVGAFSVEDRTAIEGKEIILVDDVYTSGSTINECAKVLKKNGADKIYVVTIARMAG